MLPRRILRSVLFLVVIASVMLAACAPPATPPPAETAAPPAETVAPPAETVEPVEPTTPPEPPPAERKVATIIWTQEFDTLNPLYTNMWFVSAVFPIYTCQAWWFGENNTPVPNLVTEIPSSENGGISEDGRTITLKLRDDIKWSDGTPITSADFKFTYDMELADGNAVSSRAPYDLIETFETPDERTVAVTFTEPYAPWLAQLFSGIGGISIIPAHILQPVFDEAGTIDTAEWNKNPSVGCGPFVLEEWESGSFARFVANDNFWLGKPKLDEIFFRFVPDDASQIAALKAGDGDIGTFFAYSDVPDLEAAGIEIINSFSGYNEGWYFNLHPEKGNPALKDVRVRQAIAMGFNREKLVQDLLLGLTDVAATDWDNSPWVDPSLQPWPYDPEKAKALLAEAGWVDTNGDGTVDKDGVELVLKYGTTNREVRQDTQAVAQQDLAQIGVKLDLQSFDADIFFASYSENGPSANFSLDIIEYSDSPDFPDPNTVVWRCAEIPSDENPAGVNGTGLCDEQLEALWVQQSTQVDFAQRQQTLYQITKYIYDNVYWLGLWSDPDLFGVSKRLVNVKVSGATPFYTVFDWDIAGEAPAAVELPDLGGKSVTVAVENAYPPFNYIDQDTNIGIGWDYDTVTEICKRLNCVPEFKEAAWDGIFPAMEAGEFDMLADGVTFTAERDEIVDFSIPYVIIGQVLLVRADETLDVEAMKADSAQIVGTQLGTTNEIVAKENFPEDRVKSFEDFGATVLALLASDIDGVVIDNVSASGYMRENEGKMKIAGQLTSDEELAFVFPPGSELKAAVDAALQSMIDDGTLETLNKKWGLVSE
jgi:ABC-type transport system substrate-binding protein/ABC-type amino acid transport substrate-binding protein